MRKFYASCPVCEHQHRVRFLKWFFAPNMHSLWVHILQPSGCMIYWRWLRCPACRKRSWTPLENETIVEGRRLVNDRLQGVNAGFKDLIDYLAEHRDEVMEELKK